VDSIIKNPKVFNSKTIQTITQYSHLIETTALTSTISMGVKGFKNTIKKISLSMNYEPISLISLSYFCNLKL